MLELQQDGYVLPTGGHLETGVPSHGPPESGPPSSLKSFLIFISHRWRGCPVNGGDFREGPRIPSSLTPSIEIRVLLKYSDFISILKYQ